VLKISSGFLRSELVVVIILRSSLVNNPHVSLVVSKQGNSSRSQIKTTNYDDVAKGIDENIFYNFGIINMEN
jgi:hypothetical protein